VKNPPPHSPAGRCRISRNVPIRLTEPRLFWYVEIRHAHRPGSSKCNGLQAPASQAAGTRPFPKGNISSFFKRNMAFPNNHSFFQCCISYLTILLNHTCKIPYPELYFSEGPLRSYKLPSLLEELQYQEIIKTSPLCSSNSSCPEAASSSQLMLNKGNALLKDTSHALKMKCLARGSSVLVD